VSEDRFDDLGAERRRAIGDRLEERDRTHPEGPPRPPPRPRATNKYAWAVGILFVMILSVILFVQTIPNSGKALFGPEPGTRLQAFAAPSATGDLEGDVNVCQKEPCPEGAGPLPACEVVADDVVNLCELRRRPLVLTFVFDRGADCHPQVDRTERVSGELEGVQFATVYFSRDKSNGEIRRLARARGWSQPVAIDRDGTLPNLYGIGGCPTTIFLKPGGVVDDVRLGNLTEAQLRASAEKLQG
jgi:hypothetical protein